MPALVAKKSCPLNILNWYTFTVRRGIVWGLAVLLTLCPLHRAQASGPVPLIDVIVIPSLLERRGQPFDVEVYASNIGSDAKGGGSITISLPEGGDVAIVDAGPGVPILAEPSLEECRDISTRAMIVKPGTVCHQALQHNTACKSRVNVRYPLAEVWHRQWTAGAQHYLSVRVFPRQDTDYVTVYVRVAMRAEQRGCDLRLEPTARNASAYDQQDFPV